jgi:hypothetical protein
MTSTRSNENLVVAWCNAAPMKLARGFEAGLEKSRELGTCGILRQALLVDVLQLPLSGSFRMTAFGKVKSLRPKRRA